MLECERTRECVSNVEIQCVRAFGNGKDLLLSAHGIFYKHKRRVRNSIKTLFTPSPESEMKWPTRR